MNSAMRGARAVLFDFDGPLCHVFAGLPASGIAHDLAEIVGGDVVTDDPMEVLLQSVQFGPEMVRRVEDELIAAEVRAIGVATATPGGVESIRACLAASLPVGVVSNNSARAISVFLARWNILDSVKPVVGRAYLHPEWMKPNVRPMKQALRELDCAPDAAVFIGDSRTDIEVAAAVGIPCVAYANQPGKRAQFSAMGADVVDSMWEVEAVLGARRGQR